MRRCESCGYPAGRHELSCPEVDRSRDSAYADFLLAWSRDGIPSGESQEEYARRTGQTDMVSL